MCRSAVWYETVVMRDSRSSASRPFGDSDYGPAISYAHSFDTFQVPTAHRLDALAQGPFLDPVRSDSSSVLCRFSIAQPQRGVRRHRALP